MKWCLKSFTVLLSVCLLGGAAGVAHAQTWNLVWSDEGNGAANTPPDPSKWVFDNPTAGSSNQELEYYCGQPGAGQTGNCANWLQNAHYDGAGNLVITAVTVNGQWTSARLLTASKFTPQFGKIEARIQLPFAAGFWPAFWEEPWGEAPCARTGPPAGLNSHTRAHNTMPSTMPDAFLNLIWPPRELQNFKFLNNKKSSPNRFQSKLNYPVLSLRRSDLAVCAGLRHPV